MKGNEYIKEFVKIAEYAVKSGKVKVDHGFIYIPKSVIESMMKHNNYDTVSGKLKIWKTLHWIDTDKDKYTRKICIEGVRHRVVKMDEGVYRTLKELFSD